MDYAGEIATEFFFFHFFVNTADFSTGMSGRLRRASYVMFDERDLVYFILVLPVPVQSHAVEPLERQFQAESCCTFL